MDGTFRHLIPSVFSEENKTPTAIPAYRIGSFSGDYFSHCYFNVILSQVTTGKMVVVAHAFNPSPLEAEADGSLNLRTAWSPGQPGSPHPQTKQNTPKPPP